MKTLLQYITIIVIGFHLLACTSNKSDLEKIVSEWQRKGIIFPEVMTDILTGDTIDLSGADFTIITYVDSTGCTGCKMKLSITGEFSNSVYMFYEGFDYPTIIHVYGDVL